MKINNLKWFYYMNSIAIAKFFICSLTNNWIHMNRINSFDIGMLVHYSANSAEHIVHGLTEIFSAMSSKNNQSAILCPI